MLRSLAALAPLIVLAAPSSSGHRAVRDVMVIALDYAFQSPDTVRAGETSFGLDNRGKVLHELFVAPLRAGVTAADFAKAVQQMTPRQLAEGHTDGFAPGLIFAAPGTVSRARLVLELERGRTYMLFCVLRDTPEAHRHTSLGMFRPLVVK